MVDYVSMLNACIRNMRSIPGMEVYRRDGKADTNTSVKEASERWSKAHGGLPFPVSLLEMYCSMESDGISFVGRVARPEGSFPGQQITTTSTPPSTSPQKVSVCQCHLNSVADIVEVSRAEIFKGCVGGDEVHGSATVRYFMLSSANDGTSGKTIDSVGINIYLKFIIASPSSSVGHHHMADAAVEVWGQIGSTTTSNGPSNVFIISKTIDDYVRLGCKRYAWVRGWQGLFSPLPETAAMYHSNHSMSPWVALLQE